MIRAKNNPVKPLQKIEISITEILIAGDGSLKPYLQTFHYEPENIALAPLGSVFGIFEIEDQSEDSAYIVNFLASIVKKEYFSHPKRAAIESLEATLHKINVALSELIKQDNTAWLGKLNATLCVFEKNNVHFSVSGKAKTLLIRNGTLTDISEGLAEESDIHPLKTFTEVSSGRLKYGDKLILTTPGFFEIFSPSEVEKSSHRFSDEQFSQFVKTALVNQLLFGGTLIINVVEAQAKTSILKQNTDPVREDPDIPNAFSQSAFLRKKAPTSTPASSPLSEPSESDSPNTHPSGYTDSKTGHIYVQGDTPQVPQNETWLRIRWLIEETFSNIMYTARKLSVRYMRALQNAVTRDTFSTYSKPSDTTPTYSTAEENPVLENTPPRFTDSTSSEAAEVQDSYQASPSIKIPVTVQEHEPRLARLRQYGKHMVSSIASVFAPLQKKISSRLLSLRNTFLTLRPRQRFSLFVGIFCLLVLLIFIIQTQRSPKIAPVPIEEASPIATSQPLEQDTNIRLVSSVSTVFGDPAILSTVLLKETPFGITKNSIVNLGDPQQIQSFALPETIGGNIVRATPMHDLSAIFLLTDSGKIITFTPSNHAFTENNIALPEASHIADMATYLTYLYILDHEDNMIYRYPRAAGGFGDRLPWLKETIDIRPADAMTVNENVYLVQNSQLLVFNKGTRNPLTIEASSTPVIFTNIFAQTAIQSLYVLDAVNGRLIQFEKSGAILNQYAHEKIKTATSVTVDAQKKTAYFTTSSEVFSINVE